jgi:Protein of unknown function (DUF1587)
LIAWIEAGAVVGSAQECRRPWRGAGASPQQLRDSRLTGVDIRPTKEFPVDLANTAGFDNAGESSTMSPALLKTYLQAARDVDNHMALTPDGITFAPYTMLVETDREKFAIQRIVDFYKQQPTDYADYFRPRDATSYNRVATVCFDFLTAALIVRYVVGDH